MTKYDAEWEALWTLRTTVPESKVVTGGVTRESPRVHASYGVVPAYKGCEPSYMFSGACGDSANGTRKEIPQLLQSLVDYFNGNCANSDGPYNEVTVNWYENGNNYTAQHADYMEGMDPTVPIVIVTFCPDEKSGKLLRQFWIRAKESPAASGDGTSGGADDGRFPRCRSILAPEEKASSPSVILVDSLTIPTHHGRVITMGGQMQNQFRHGVPKYSVDPEACAPRVSVTLRAYCTK